MLSTSSFNALLKTLEEPPPHVVFIFATTDPEKIPKTVQSRCLQLNLKTIGKQALTEHMLNIVKKEDIKHDEESLTLIADSAKGSVRDALTLLDQSIAHGNGALNEQDVRNLLGTIDGAMIGDLVSSIINGDPEKSFNIFYQIEELNPEYENILKSMVSFIHEVSLEQFLKNSNDENIIKIAERADKEFIQLVYEIAVNAYSKFSIHPEPKQALEICILRMLAFNPIASIHESSSATNAKETPEKKTLKIEQSSSKADRKNQNIDQKTVNTKNNDFLKIINSNNEWVNVFNKLQMSVFAKNYFGHLVFIKMENNRIYLEGDIENNKIPKNVKAEFEKVCTEFFKKDIKIDMSHSTKKGGPLFIKEQEDIVKQNAAENNIKNDDSIKDFMNRFDATLKDKSIKPIN
jgi:DNA polymerase-3 subunit gamma/tau